MGEPIHDECLEAVHRLYHFLDGELTSEKRLEISKHLDSCHPCLEAFDFEADLRHMLAAKCRDHVPETLRDRVAWALRHEQEADQHR
ncbi:MAG TPA: mycothiol system anti-sigma-R factor [Actinomycetota bacterium]|jgi:mycothiol system anti-sigma-R factor|nr:mycothiol system anti-sigma-R factor [Actinomycetota bacterium]